MCETYTPKNGHFVEVHGVAPAVLAPFSVKQTRAENCGGVRSSARNLSVREAWRQTATTLRASPASSVPLTLFFLAQNEQCQVLTLATRNLSRVGDLQEIIRSATHGPSSRPTNTHTSSSSPKLALQAESLSMNLLSSSVKPVIG